MSNLIRINNEYANWIKDLSLRFRQSQMKAAVKVNRELLKFYFVLGADIVNKQAESKWGEGFFRNLSQDLRDALPDVKGLSETNLKYTKYFYLLYSPLIEVQNASETFSSFHPQLVDDSGKTLVNPQSTKEIEKHPQLVDELETILSIPWGHHRFIIDKCNGDTRKGHRGIFLWMCPPCAHKILDLGTEQHGQHKHHHEIPAVEQASPTKHTGVFIGRVQSGGYHSIA